MAEEQQQKDFTRQHTEDLKEEKTQSGDESRPEDPAADVKQQLSEALPSTPATREAQDSVEDGDWDENKVMPLTKGSSSSGGDRTTNAEDISRVDNESHGDYNRELQSNEALDVEAEATSVEDDSEANKAREANMPVVLDDKMDEQVDGPKAYLEESPATNDTNTEAEEDLLNASAPEEETYTQENTISESDEQRNHVETIHPTYEEVSEPAVPETTRIPGGSGGFLITVGLVVLVAILVQYFPKLESPPQKNDVRQVDIFLKQLEKVKTRFPGQRAELWNRSRIHLKRHLQTAQPTEPVSLILTAGLGAERTLFCLAQSLASTFSSALNASVLHIDGASKSSVDSDQVKLDIDSKLQGAFEGDKPVAVIHRFEELPPGSTLIFYRYCDHENAAYKKTFLIFTVLLGEEEEIPAEIHLSAVEEMVDDHLKKKFLSHDLPVSFDRMDLDKYGGLWSRISHLILPVAAEERIESEGC
ncbi:torsin-1A-interacting protein 2-like isoform 2-T2 [Odontesthes bonariensis]|uniref:torsin-1A-interacting protein 2-like isoform X2 n=1 Tax=Odontesthes bonariensis TaxID=219752 RepID=UPI003F58FBC1